MPDIQAEKRQNAKTPSMQPLKLVQRQCSSGWYSSFSQRRPVSSLPLHPACQPRTFRHGSMPACPALGRPSLVIRRPICFLLVEQVRPRRAEIDDLGAAVTVLLEAGALEAVEGVGDALAAADDALVLVVAEGALVADADEGRGADVGVADGALAVALVAEAADGDAGLFAAHDQIAGEC